MLINNPAATNTTPLPRLKIRINMEASRGCNSDIPAAAIPETAMLAIIVTLVRLKCTACRSITNDASDSGRPMRTSVAKQSAVSPRLIPPGPHLRWLVDEIGVRPIGHAPASDDVGAAIHVAGMLMKPLVTLC